MNITEKYAVKKHGSVYLKTIYEDNGTFWINDINRALHVNKAEAQRLAKITGGKIIKLK